MAVTKDQAEMFTGVAAGLKLDIVEVSKDILEKAVLVGADMVCESYGEVERLEARVEELEKCIKNTCLPALVLATNDYPQSVGPRAQLNDVKRVLRKGKGE